MAGRQQLVAQRGQALPAVFHAGTRREAGATVTSGGRVLAVTAVGEDIDDAAARAYRAVECVRFEGKQLRRDIGWQARRRLG